MVNSRPRNAKLTPQITKSSGNIFADIGLRNPEQELLKARLILQIYKTIKERKLTDALQTKLTAAITAFQLQYKA